MNASFYDCVAAAVAVFHHLYLSLLLFHSVQWGINNLLNWVDWLLSVDLCVFWIIYNTNHRIFTNKININNESINCAPISRSSSNNNDKIERWRDRHRGRRCRMLFVTFNNLIILQYNTFIWLVFSIEVPVYMVENSWRTVINSRKWIKFSIYVLIDGKLPLFTIEFIYTYM